MSRPMNRMRRALGWPLLVALMTTAASLGAQSASQRGQPRQAFGIEDFRRLRWLDGAWLGSAPGEPSTYERYRYANDSTIEITYFADSTFSRETGNGRVYMSVGRIFHTFGAARWGATNVDSSGGVYFIPQVNARNTFAWKYESPNAWTATQRSGASGKDRVTTYEMRRVARR